MADREELLALAEKLEASGGGSNQLDLWIAMALYPKAPSGGYAKATKRFTFSLDEAVVLVEDVAPEWQWLVDYDDLRSPSYCAQVKRQGEDWEHSYRQTAATPALALTAALLRALAADDGGS
ncbi:MAG: hypothetical protein AAGK02_07190 [Pseudomonadota bacterium]